MSYASTSVIQIIPRTRRGVELFLLVIAVGVSVAAYVNIGITAQDGVPASTGLYAAGIGLLALIAHLALRFRAPYADPVILPCAVLLNGKYGVDGLFVGVPVKLGRGGVSEVIEIELTADEQAAFDKSAAAVRELVDAMERLNAAK
jgi:hypothetical protein